MRFTIVTDETNDDGLLVVMGHGKPEVAVSSTPYDGMRIIRHRIRNRADTPIPEHFPLNPGSRDRVIVRRDCNEIPPDPPWPTDFTPGTPEKIEVMAWRYRMGFKVHHPLDARLNTRRRISEHELSNV